MKKVEEWRSSVMTREIASQMVVFVEGRLELMKTYEQIANEGSSPFQNLNYRFQIRSTLTAGLISY